MSEDAPTLARLGPGATVQRLRRAWRDHAAGPPQEPALRDALARVAQGDRAAWPSLARSLWLDPSQAPVLGRLIGLRTRLWTAGCGGLMPAITALVLHAVRSGEELAAGVGCAEAHLWVPDPLFRAFVHALEMDAAGSGIAWELVPDAPSAAGSGAGGVWQAWTRWMAGGGMCPRAWVASPRWVGCLPATGLPLTSPHVAALAAGLRTLPSPGPLLVAPDPPQLLPWAVPAATTTVGAGGARSALPGAAAPGMATLRLEGVEAAAVALAACLARTGTVDPLPALVQVIADVALQLACLGVEDATGGLRSPLPGPHHLGSVRCGRVGDQLAVEAEGVAGIISWMGWFPLCYQIDARLPMRWRFRELEQCGWQALQRAGAWEVGTSDGSASRWIRFPTTARQVPVLRTPWTPLPAIPAPRRQAAWLWDPADTRHGT